MEAEVSGVRDGGEDVVGAGPIWERRSAWLGHLLWKCQVQHNTAQNSLQPTFWQTTQTST